MSINLTDILVLLVVFQIKHFIADFPLQREYMLRKTDPTWGFLGPLTLHCFVHSMGALTIALIFRPELWWIMIIDFVIHFIMDRIKSGPKYLGRFNDIRKQSYWNCLGFDQMIHHLTNYLNIWLILTWM